jgi:hypothetical protein
MQNIDHSLAFTALLELMPGFGQMEVGAGDALITQLVQAWRGRTDRDTLLWDFTRAWIKEVQA